MQNTASQPSPQLKIWKGLHANTLPYTHDNLVVNCANSIFEIFISKYLFKIDTQNLSQNEIDMSPRDT